MFDIKVTLLLCFVVVTVAAEFSNEQLIDVIDSDESGTLSDEEFDNWIDLWFDYKKTPTILGMTGDIPVERFIEVLDRYPSNSGYTAEDAARYADEDGNGEINASEFDRWFRHLPPGTDKAETIFEFTGNIGLCTFRDYLKENKPETKHEPGYGVDQAVKYANENRNDEIDAHEFNRWYNGVKHFTAESLKPLMEDEHGVITVEKFLYVIGNL